MLIIADEAGRAEAILQDFSHKFLRRLVVKGVAKIKFAMEPKSVQGP